MSTKRSVAKYSIAAVATGLYGAAAFQEFRTRPEDRRKSDSNPRKVYAVAAGLAGMTWLVAWL